MPAPPLTAAEFHLVIQKQIAGALLDTFADTKLDWAAIEPFVEAARRLCAGEFDAGGRVRLHTVRAEGDQWVDAEEAFLGIAVAGEGEDEPWLARTWWLSDLAMAEGDPEEARRILHALERSVLRLRARLDAGQEKGPAEGAAGPESESGEG